MSIVLFALLAVGLVVIAGLMITRMHWPRYQPATVKVVARPLARDRADGIGRRWRHDHGRL